MGELPPWNPAAADLVMVWMAAAVLYLVYDRVFTPQWLEEWWKRRGVDSQEAQARGAVGSHLWGGLVLGGGSVLAALLRGRSLSDVGWSLQKWEGAVLGAVASIVLLAPVLIRAAGTPAVQALHPRIRSLNLTPRRVLWGALGWFGYLWGYETFFRGWLILYLVPGMDPWAAVASSTALYVYAHLGKPTPEAVGTVLMGGVFGAFALATGSVVGPFLLHFLISQTTEMAAARCRPGVMWWGREGDDE